MNKFLKLYKTRTFWFFEHLIFFMGPMYLVFTNPENKLLQYGALIFTINYMVMISTWAGARAEVIGLTRKYFKKALNFIALPTVVFGVLIFLLKKVFPQISAGTHQGLISSLEYIFIAVPLQEIVFRGFCLWRCKLTFKNIIFLVSFNSFMFAMYHMIFQNWYFTGGLFMVNIFLSYGFTKYPNLFAFMIAHTFLGFIYFLKI